MKYKMVKKAKLIIRYKFVFKYFTTLVLQMKLTTLTKYATGQQVLFNPGGELISRRKSTKLKSNLKKN